MKNIPSLKLRLKNDTSRFGEAFNACSTTTASAVEMTQSIIDHLSSIAAPSGVKVASAIHIPMVKTEHCTNTLATVTLTHPKAVSSANLTIGFAGLCSQSRISGRFTLYAFVQCKHELANSDGIKNESFAAILHELTSQLWGFSLTG